MESDASLRCTLPPRHKTHTPCHTARSAKEKSAYGERDVGTQSTASCPRHRRTIRRTFDHALDRPDAIIGISSLEECARLSFDHRISQSFNPGGNHRHSARGSLDTDDPESFHISGYGNIGHEHHARIFQQDISLIFTAVRMQKNGAAERLFLYHFFDQ